MSNEALEKLSDNKLIYEYAKAKEEESAAKKRVDAVAAEIHIDLHAFVRFAQTQHPAALRHVFFYGERHFAVLPYKQIDLLQAG